MMRMDYDDPENDEELYDWDFEHAEVRPPVKSPGAVVSVRFDGDDFERIARQADSEGISLIDFIRRAALEKADRSIRDSTLVPH